LGRFRFSTDELPEKDRMAIVNEVVAKRTHCQHLPLFPDRPFYVHGDSCVLPGMLAYRSSFSPMRIVRSREQLSDSNDNLVVSWFNHARITSYWESEVGPGAATLMSAASNEAMGILPIACCHAVIIVPRKTLAPLLRDIDGSLMRPMPAESPALDLMLQYMDLIYEHSAAPIALQSAMVAHMHDLLGILFGATRDAAEAAKNGGVRAARLHAIKRDIRENLANGGLSASAVAARHRLTTRYMQMLFETEGATFTQFLRDERLARAYKLLSSPRWRDRKIVEIALACGFNDLSHFNRAFRACFGATPSDVRAASSFK